MPDPDVKMLFRRAGDRAPGLLLVLAMGACGGARVPTDQASTGQSTEATGSSVDDAGPNGSSDSSDHSSGTDTGPVETGCFRQLAAGAGTFVVRSDGTLWGWGGNSSGQLGIGTTESPQPVPVQVTALGTEVVQVSGNLGHTCALKVDGTVWCWGSNESGRLGDGTRNDRLSPVRVKGLAEAVEVAAGRRHTCARTYDAKLWCWGGGDLVGDGGVADQLDPVEVIALGSGVAQVSAGTQHTCAVKTDGTLWCWGRLNGNGVIGDGTTEVRKIPVQVDALGSDVTWVSAGTTTTCAAKTDGTLWCWGANEDGQVGDGTTETPRTSPVRVEALGSDVAQVSTNNRVTCARKHDGTLWCWGRNEAGSIGDGTIDPTCELVGPCEMSRSEPVWVEALGNEVAAVAVGGHVCARTRDDSVWCWGPNGNGHIGDGTTDGEPYTVGTVDGVSRPSPTRSLIECP